MIAAPMLLFRPDIVLRVLAARLRRGQPRTPARGATQATLVSVGDQDRLAV
jgi:hypothetical protein